MLLSKLDPDIRREAELEIDKWFVSKERKKEGFVTRNRPRTLDTAFVWEYSEKGYEYWKNINDGCAKRERILSIKV